MSRINGEGASWKEIAVLGGLGLGATAAGVEALKGSMEHDMEQQAKIRTAEKAKDQAEAKLHDSTFLRDQAQKIETMIESSSGSTEKGDPKGSVIDEVSAAAGSLLKEGSKTRNAVDSFIGRFNK